MIDASCYVALLPEEQAAQDCPLPGDGAGAGAAGHDWTAWHAAPAVAPDTDAPANLAALSVLLWRWSGRSALTLHLRHPGQAAWSRAAVRLTGTASWQALVQAWRAALAGPLPWPDPVPASAGAGLDLGAPAAASGSAPVPAALVVQWRAASAGAALAARQRGQWLAESTLALMARGWHAALAAPAACALDAIPMLALDVAQAHWTRPAAPAHAGAFLVSTPVSTLASTLARLAASDPDALAVAGAGVQLGYGALYAAASALAQRIVALAGPHPEAIGIMFAPGPQMLVAVYGALLANKYYVPLDPDYPAARLGAMVAAADPVLILAEAPLQARARAIADGIAVLDAQAAPGAAVLPEVAPASLAYVLFTSGSSGTPKGVMQSHDNVLFHGATYGASLGLGRADRVALMASLCFDASVMDIFGALAAGASVFPYAPARTDPAALLAALARDAITVLHATPTLFRLLFGAPGAVAPPQVRAVVLGGELVAPSDVALFFAIFGPAVTLINGYGPSESTMALQYRTSAHDGAGACGIVPVGYPLPGVVATVGQPGAPWRAFQEGELFLHSAHLFRGYLGRDEDSAACLAPGSDGRTYYRTGDLALRLPDGRVAVRGRVDQQVKLHGFRIEPGDIEAQLLAFPGVRQAAVRLGRRDGRPALLAYIGHGAGAIDEAALRRHLQARLPAYMQPACIVQLDSLPRTPSGKIDRLALPESVAAQEGAAAAGEGTEARLALLWREVLGAQPPREADFFGAGGHSLAALQLVGRVRQAFGVDYPLQRIFDTPSLAQMAADLDALGGRAPAGRPAPAVTALPAPVSAMPLAPVQRGLWYLHHTGEAAARAYNMQLALRLHGAFDGAALALALAGLTARHAVLRTGFPLAQDGPVQDVRASVPLRLRQVDLPGAALDPCADALVQELARAEAAEPFDLAAPPLMRVVHGCLAPGQHFIIVTLHHLVADGWSLPLLLRELAELYRAAATGQAASLAPLTLEYADHARAGHAALTDAVRAQGADFWRAYLDGAAPVLSWKTPDPAVPAYTGGSYTFAVPAALRDGLTGLGARQRATPFMTLLAVWGLQLAAESGRNDIVVGTAAANRPTPATERLIGMFVNALPIRVQVTPAMGFAAYLRRVREACLAAFANQALPFDELAQLLGRAGGGARHVNPVFQVMLTLDAFGVAEAMPAAPFDVTVLGRTQQTSHVDLALSFQPHGDGWSATLTYARALFSDRDALRLAGDLLALMGKVVARDDAPCTELGCAQPFAEEQEW